MSKTLIYRPDLYNLQTRKKKQKTYWELKLTLLNISILITSNINTGHKSMIVSNKSQKLIKLDISEIKDSTHTVYWSTNWNIEILEPWNWTFHMTLLKALKYTPCLSFWASQKTIVENYWLNSYDLLTSYNNLRVANNWK